MIELANYCIEISDKVLDDLDSLKQNSPKSNEAGGVLLGYVVDETKCIRITKISVPSRYDKSSPNSFTRDCDTTQKIIDEEFNESEGKIIYLGEWHTHYEKKPVPSGVDISMIKRLYNVGTFNYNLLLLLIKGTQHTYISSYNGKKFVSKYF